MSIQELTKEPFNMVIAGVGGQGNVLLSGFVGSALLNKGYMVSVADTFGVSQRGGSVASHIKISKDTLYSSATLNGKADVVLGMEPVETLRNLGKFGNPDVVAIVNPRPVYPSGGVSYPDLEKVKEAIEQLSAKTSYINATEFYRVRELGKAIENFERAMELDPTYVDPLYGLGRIYLVDTQEFDKALAMYERAKDLAPGDAFSHSSLAYAYFVMGRYQDCVDEYIAAVQINGKDGDAFLNLGYAYEKMEMDLAAIEAYRRAQELMPDDTRASQSLAHIYYRAGLYDQAIKSYEKIRSRGQASNYTLSTLGFLYMKVGQSAKAEALFLAVLQRSPEDVAARANLASVYRDSGDTAKAIEQYEYLHAAQPNDIAYMLALADAYNDAGRYDSAISMARKVLGVKPGLGSAYIAWAKALEKQGDYEGAIAKLELAKGDPEWRSLAIREIERQNQLIEIRDQQRARDRWDQG